MTEIRDVAGLPVTPYNGTGGWSGTETSKARAEYMVASGELSKTQRGVIQHLLTAKAYGATWKEIRLPDTKSGGFMHHGSISGALSNLHKKGTISRLTSKRDGCLVYVCNEWVGDRESSPFTPHKKQRTKFSLSDKDKPNPKAVSDYLMRQPIMVKVHDALIPITPQVAEGMAREIADLS